MSRFQQEIRLLRTKLLDIERRIEEKKLATIELRKDLERVSDLCHNDVSLFIPTVVQIRTGNIELVTRLELLEGSYTQQEEELRRELMWFLVDQTQLAKTFRRDVDELKRMQQEHMSKLDIHGIASTFDDLIQQQINKLYQYKHLEDDEDEEDESLENGQRLIKDFDKLHDDNVTWLKKKKKSAKARSSLVERFREFLHPSCPITLFSWLF